MLLSYGGTEIQKLDANGNKQWQMVRMLVQVVVFHRFAVDGEGNAFVVWGNSGIYAQKLSASGSKLWTAECASQFCQQHVPAVTTDGSGNAVVCGSSKMPLAIGETFMPKSWMQNGIRLWTVDAQVNSEIDAVSSYVAGSLQIWQECIRCMGGTRDGNMYAKS